MITSLSGSFSGLIAYRDNSNVPFRGTFDSRFQEFDRFGLSAAIDALSDQRVAQQITSFLPLTGSFVGVPPGATVAVRSADTINLTIDGEGFFILIDPNVGTPVYARNVSVMVGSGQVMSFGIYPLQPQITLPLDTSNFFITADGMVSVTIGSDPNLITVGQMQLSTFATPPIDIGGGLFVEGASPAIYDVPGNNGLGTVKQGFVEEVNHARGDIVEVVIRIDATFTSDNGPGDTFAVVYESGNARLIGSTAAINTLRADSQGFLARFNTILQNTTGDPNLAVQ